MKTGSVAKDHPIVCVGGSAGGLDYGPRVLFALAYGGNGITYSMLGAGLLRAQIEGRPHPLTGLFSFTRLGYQ